MNFFPKQGDGFSGALADTAVTHSAGTMSRYGAFIQRQVMHGAKTHAPAAVDAGFCIDF